MTERSLAGRLDVIEAGEMNGEAGQMHLLQDKWFLIAAAAIVIFVLAYMGGWFGGEAPPTTTTAPARP